MNRVLCGQRQTVWLVRSIGARLPVHGAVGRYSSGCGGTGLTCVVEERRDAPCPVSVKPGPSQSKNEEGSYSESYTALADSRLPTRRRLALMASLIAKIRKWLRIGKKS